jgi:hypothetical protein
MPIFHELFEGKYVRTPIFHELFEVMGVAAFAQVTQDGHYFCNRFTSSLNAIRFPVRFMMTIPRISSIFD